MAKKEEQEKVHDETLELEVGLTMIDFKKPARRLLDVLEEIAPQGERVKTDDLIGKEITLHSIRTFQGENGPAAFCLVTDEGGALYNTIIGGKIVYPKLLAVQGQLPVSFKLVKKEGGRYGRYWDVE